MKLTMNFNLSIYSSLSYMYMYLSCFHTFICSFVDKIATYVSKKVQAINMHYRVHVQVYNLYYIQSVYSGYLSQLAQRNHYSSYIAVAQRLAISYVFILLYFLFYSVLLCSIFTLNVWSRIRIIQSIILS